MDKTRYSVRFNRKNKLNKQGLAPVQIECLLNRKRRFFDTKIKVSPNDWDNTQKRVKNTHPNAIKLNQRISQIITEFEEYELSFLNAKKPFNLSMFDNLYKVPIYSNFNEFMEYEITHSKNTEATRKSQRATLKRLSQFRKNIDFSGITFEFLHDFERFCRRQTTPVKGGKKPLSDNTIWKYFKDIKTYVNLAINKELISVDKYPFRKFKFTLKETEKTYLTPHEIEKIEALRLYGEYDKYQYIKELFLFSVYTGLRYSDVMSLEKMNIVIQNGNEWLIKETEKTGEMVKIPIYAIFNGKALDIIKKHWDLTRPQCFQYLTNQHLNRELKTLSKLAGIRKNITFHTARHTTATYLLYKGANMSVVQKILGHKKISTTQIYGHIMDMTIENEIKAINF